MTTSTRASSTVGDDRTDGTTQAIERAARTAAEAGIVSEISIASAAATETRTHQPRAANGRFVVGPPGTAPVAEESEVLQAEIGRAHV